MAVLCVGRVLGRAPGLVRRGQPRGSARITSASAGRRCANRCTRPRTRSRCARGSAARCSASTARRRTSGGSTPTASWTRCVDEVERTVAGARERGVGRVSIFFADDEFNLPDERHPIAVLRGIHERGLDEAHDVARVLQPHALLGRVRRARSRDERPRLDHRRQRGRRVARDSSKAVQEAPSRRSDRASHRARRLRRSRADLRAPRRDEGDDCRDDRLRALAAGVDRGRVLGRRARLSAHTSRPDRRARARVARRPRRPDVPDADRLLAALAAARARAKARR